MNARFESETDYLTHQTLLMGLAAGGGIGDIPSMSQSYRRAVLKNPPKGEFKFVVLPPVKQGSNWHYGGRVVPVPNPNPDLPDDNKDFREYTIYRKWEDCLDLQKTVEREYSFLSFRRRRQAQLGTESQPSVNVPPTPTSTAHTSTSTASSSSRSTHSSTGSKPRSSSPVDMYGAASYYANNSPKRPAEPVGQHSDAALSIYKQPRNRAASFESLPQGLEPLSVAVDVHVLVPKLSKKAALFGRPSNQLLAQREEDFRAFIDAIFGIETPAMEELRKSRAFRDWFGYWKRDKESAVKSGGPGGAPLSPTPSHSPDGTTSVLPASSAASTITVVPIAQDKRSPAGGMTLAIPPLPPNANRASTASSGSDDTPESVGHDASVSEDDDDDDDELLDIFPITPQGHPAQGTFPPPIVRAGALGSSPQDASRSPPMSATKSMPSSPKMPVPPPMQPPQQQQQQQMGSQYYGLSVGGMMAPAPIFRSRSNPPRPGTAPAAAGSSSMSTGFAPPQGPAPPRPAPPSPSQRISDPPQTKVPTIRTPRAQRPSTAGASTNRQGRVFIVEPPERRPRSANSNASSGGQRPGMLSVNTAVPSASSSAARSAVEATTVGRPAAPSPTSSSSNVNRPRAQTLGYVPRTSVESHEEALATTLQNFRNEQGKTSMDSETGSFLHYALPAWSIPSPSPSPGMPQPTPPPPESPSSISKRRTPTARGGRHSISSIESYLSDSSIDAALSTLRMAPTVPSSSSPSTSTGVRRSMSTGSRRARSSSFVARVPEEVSEEMPLDQSRMRWSDRNLERRLLAQALLDEDEDVVDSYFYQPAHPRSVSPSVRGGRAHSHRSNSISSTSGAGGGDIFNLKVLFPNFADCAAIALRLPRTTTFDELQIRLHQKFHEAEGIDLNQFRKGFRLGYKPGPRMSMGMGAGLERKERSMSVSSGTSTMLDPNLLTIVKNDEDWRAAIPGVREKLTLQVIVDA